MLVTPLGLILTTIAGLALGTQVSTPDGDKRIEDLKEGAIVWTLDTNGKRVPGKILATKTTEVPEDHEIVELFFASGKTLSGARSHPVSGGLTLEDLGIGTGIETADGFETVLSAQAARYSGRQLRDIRPAGPTGVYWASSIPVGSSIISTPGATPIPTPSAQAWLDRGNKRFNDFRLVRIEGERVNEVHRGMEAKLKSYRQVIDAYEPVTKSGHPHRSMMALAAMGHASALLADALAAAPENLPPQRRASFRRETAGQIAAIRKRGLDYDRKAVGLQDEHGFGGPEDPLSKSYYQRVADARKRLEAAKTK